MKKLFLMMGLACLFMVACNNAPKQEVKNDEPVAQAEQHQCPFCQLKAEYANWETMDETAKKELNQKALDVFKELDAKMAEKHECGKEGEHQCGKEGEHQCAKEGEHQCAKEGEGKPCPKEGMPEMTPEQKAECEAKCAEMKAKCEAMKAAWEAFETKTLDEQKDLVLERIAAMGMGGKCEKDGEEHHCGGESK